MSYDVAPRTAAASLIHQRVTSFVIIPPPSHPPEPVAVSGVDNPADIEITGTKSSKRLLKYRDLSSR